MNTLPTETAIGTVQAFSTRPTALERRVGRILRGPEGHPSDDNSSGNEGQSGSESQQQNNSGQGFDYSTFWTGSGESQSGSSRGGESAESGSGSSGSQQTQQEQKQETNPAEALATELQGLNFNPQVMSEAAISELSEGKTESFHKGLNDFGRNVTQQTLRMTLGIMAQVRDQMMATMREEFQGTLTNKDNDSALLQAIPSAKDPKVRPVVDSIYKRALQISKGDTAAAIDMTKHMMRLQVDTLGDDIGVPPRGRGDSFGNERPTDWLNELVGR